jgi:Fe2+ or Zn2+ uptake regulation protein
LISYLVFACSQCKHYTNAPAGQKHRRCSYCGTIIDITKASCAVFDNADSASAAVREFNAKDSNEFQLAVERSKEKLRTLMPKETLTVEGISSEGGETAPPGKRKRLLDMLEKEAKEKPWVEEQLSMLADNGLLVFPRPWTVQLLPSSESKAEKVTSKTDIRREILTVVRKAGGNCAVKQLFELFAQQGVHQSSVENSLNRLMQSGELFEPKPGVVSLVDSGER